MAEQKYSEVFYEGFLEGVNAAYQSLQVMLDVQFAPDTFLTVPEIHAVVQRLANKAPESVDAMKDVHRRGISVREFLAENGIDVPEGFRI